MSDDLDDGAKVDPGDIDEFANQMLEAADYWWEKDGGPYKLTHAEPGDDHYPFVGVYEEADSFLEAHHGKWSKMSTAFQQLHAQLEGLSEGCKKVAEEYRDLEALNSTDADALDSLLEPELQEAMEDVPSPENGGNGDNPEGGDQPSGNS